MNNLMHYIAIAIICFISGMFYENFTQEPELPFVYVGRKGDMNDDLKLTIVDLSILAEEIRNEP